MYKIIVVLASLFAVIHSNPHRSSNSFYRLLTDNPLSITKVLKNYNSRPVHRNSFSSKYSGNGNKNGYTTRRRTYYKKKPNTDFPDSHKSTYPKRNDIIRPKTTIKLITTPGPTPAPTPTPAPKLAPKLAPKPEPVPTPTPTKTSEPAPKSASFLRNAIINGEDYDYYGDLFGYEFSNQISVSIRQVH